MAFGDLVSGIIGSKPLVLVLGVFAIVFLALAIPAIIVIWAYGFMTAAIFFVAGLVFLFAVHQLEILDTEKHPWVILIPILLGFVGLGMEKLELFALKQIPLSTFAMANGVLGFITAETVLLATIIVLLIIGLAQK